MTQVGLIEKRNNTCYIFQAILLSFDFISSSNEH